MFLKKFNNTKLLAVLLLATASSGLVAADITAKLPSRISTVTAGGERA